MTQRFLPKGDFARNVLTLMTGATMAQAIPVAISPILTRMYGPEDFGLLAIFAAIASIMGVMANGRYELAIMLPDDDEDALNIAALGVLIASALSAILLLIALFFNDAICRLLGNETIGPWLYFVPIVVWFTGLFQALNYFNNRLKNYKDIARATMYKAVVLASVQLALGYMKMGATGLISGQIASALFANGALLKRTLTRVNIRETVSLGRMKSLAIRYRRFPVYSMPAILANSLSQNLTSILISTFYSVATLGFYALVQRILGMPSALVGGAVGQVFFQRAMEERRETGKAIKTFDSTVKALVLVALPVFFLLYFTVEDLFAFAFGEEWRVAGTYAVVLMPFFAIKFVVSAITTINSVFEKQLLSLLWQLFLLLVSLGVIIVSGFMGFDFSAFLNVFSLSSSFCYLILYFFLRAVSRGAL